MLDLGQCMCVPGMAVSDACAAFVTYPVKRLHSSHEILGCLEWLKQLAEFLQLHQQLEFSGQLLEESVTCWEEKRILKRSQNQCST